MIKRNILMLHFGTLGLCGALLLGGCGASSRGSVAAGNEFAAHGKYRSAYIEAKKVLQRDSHNGAAWLLLGRASLMLGNPKDALNELQNAQKNGVSESDWAVPMGRALIVLENYDALVKTLSPESVPAPDPRGRIEVLRGEAFLGLKQFDKAEQAFSSALSLNTKDVLASVGLARLAMAKSNLASANQYARQALTAAPESPQAWILKGDLAFDVHDYTGAAAAYEKALGFENADWLPQDQFYARARLADAQTHQNQLDAALTNIGILEKMASEQPYPHYLHAVVLYKQGHLDDAISQLQQVLKVMPDNEPAQMLLGVVNYAQKNFAQAEMYLSNVMGMDPGNIDARRLLALTLYREGRSRQALDALRPTVRGQATDAQLLAELQRQAAAGAALPPTQSAPAQAEIPSNPQLVRARQALADGNASEAIQLLQKMPPGDAESESQRASMLVMAYVGAKRPAEAVETAANYAAQNPHSSAAHLLYGTALVAAGQHTEARAQYARAYKLDPKNLAALMSLGSLDALEGHYADANARYAAVLKAAPDNAAAMQGLAKVAAQQGDPAKAEDWLKRAIQAAPKDGGAYLALIELYTQHRQFEDAIGVAKRYADNVPDSAVAENALGVAELNAGHFQSALPPLQAAVKSAPRQTLFRLNLARALILNKQNADAERELRRVLQAAPDQLTASGLLAFLKLENDDMPAALAVARDLQQRSNTRTAGFSLEGDLYMSKSSYAKAAEAYQEGLKIDYIRPLVIKTFLALNDSGRREAEAVLRGWLTKNPKDDAARLMLAQYYLNHAQNTSAVAQYQEILTAYPSNVDALNNLAWLYTEQHDARALTTAERAYKLAPESSSVQDTYGWALIQGGQAEKALPILVQAAHSPRPSAAIQYHLAVAQAQTGDKTGAHATLAALLKSGASFPGKADAEKLYHELGGA